MSQFLLDFIKDIFAKKNLKLIKVKLHYSTLIISNQMDRDFALKEIKERMRSEELLKYRDRVYFKK